MDYYVMHACEWEMKKRTDEIDEFVLANAAAGDDENARKDDGEIRGGHEKGKRERVIVNL